MYQLIRNPLPSECITDTYCCSCCCCRCSLPLQDGAAENELSDVRYKLMNIALLTAGVGHWLVLLPRLGSEATSGPLMPVVLGTWATAALLGSVNLLQSPKAKRR